MKDNTYLFLQGMAMVEKLGYKVRSYEDIIQNEHERELFHKASEFGFVIFDSRMVCINMEQPDHEIIKTLYHEIAHILQHELDEDMADEWADLMIERAQRERMVATNGQS